ncbi:MAG: hypothetical protein AABY22_30935 [Nanoarchaeota archaeon]
MNQLHKKHNFVKKSTEIKEVPVFYRDQRLGLRRVYTFLCECGEVQLFHELPTDKEMVINYYS